MPHVGVFVDLNDQFYRVGKKYGEGKKLDYAKYMQQCQEYGDVVRAIAYGSCINNSADKFQNSLNHIGFDTNYMDIEPGRWHDWGVGIAVDIIRIHGIVQLDTVVLGVSGKQLCPLCPYLKDRGIRVVTLAVGISKELKRASTSWIDLEDEFLEPEPERTPT